MGNDSCSIKLEHDTREIYYFQTSLTASASPKQRVRFRPTPGSKAEFLQEP
jgi:hypothetical protein